MAKKTLKLPSLFRTKELPPPPKKLPWQFLPACGQQIKTLSFRTSDDTDTTFNKVNDPIGISTVESLIECASFSTDSDDHHNNNYCCYDDGESLEMFVLHGVRSERLLFEAGNNTSSILEKAEVGGGFLPLKESVVLVAMDSEDPHGDFRRSMEEMVEARRVKDWKGLEELLSWYLKVNDQKNHGFVMLAFVDLLISLAAASDYSCSDSATATSYCSAVSSIASSPLYQSRSE